MNLSDVNLLDVLAVLIVVSAVLAGVRTGALPQVGGIVGAATGLAAVLVAAPWLVDTTRTIEPVPRAVIVLGLVLGAVAIGEAIGSAIGRVLAGGLGRGVLSNLDRAVGGLVGAGQAVLVIWLAGGLLAAGPVPSVARIANGSIAVRALATVLPPPSDIVGEIATALDQSGLPDVFVGLEPLPLPAVDQPTDPQAERIAADAKGRTARVSSRACTNLVNGTGAVISPGYLVTNAHVVAGASAIRVDLGGTVADATVVLFDPELDVALLWAPDIQVSPLRFASSNPDRGTFGAALGYAGGGPLQVLPAAVSGQYAATGRDIYDSQRVTRQVLELRAAVEPGDSGGPLILEDGRIGGLVFAESRTDPNIGYALTPTEVADRIAPGIGRQGKVSTGDCIR